MEQTSAPTKLVLFVDDDANVLSGLKRLLHRFRSEWEMEFANGPREALDLIERKCFNVVVSDMRMPELDGASLLEEIKHRCPRTVRIALSGQADKEAIFHTLDSTHQYLTKPCNSEDLGARIRAACGLSDIANINNYAERIAGLVTLPSSSKSFLEFTSEISGQHPSIDKLAAIIADDPAMSAKVLQLVNSSFFSTFGSILNPEEATRMLGIDTLAALHTSGRIFRGAVDRIGSIPVSSVVAHHRKVANDAREHSLLIGLNKEKAKLAFTAMILRATGVLMQTAFWPQQLIEVARLMVSEKKTRDEAENAIFGCSNRNFSFYLLSLWGIPTKLKNLVFGTINSDSYDESDRVIVELLGEHDCSYDDCSVLLDEAISGKQ